MNIVLNSIILDWAVPYMNVHHLRTWVFEGDKASLRVFEKSNFKRLHTLENWVLISKSRRIEYRSVILMEWQGAIREDLNESVCARPC